MIVMEKRTKYFSVNKFVTTFIQNKTGSYKKEDNENIILRYEYSYYNKNREIFIYLKNWNQLINLIKTIPHNHNHFYEIIGDSCKFFLKLGKKCKDISINEWYNRINFIKKQLVIFFKNIFYKNIRILEFQRFPLISEPKLSCHLIIPDYYFYVKDCINLLNLFLNTIDIKYKDIIIDKVYEKNKMLLIENSRKLKSDRKKKCIYINNNDIKFLNLDGLITNLENTELLYTGLYMININKEIDVTQILRQNININAKKEGYLYIIIEREFIRIDEKIYKIGCTNNIIRRYKQYPKDSKIIYAIIHDKYKNIEKKWMISLNNNKKLINRKDIGREYYEGDYKIIIDELTKVIIINFSI